MKDLFKAAGIHATSKRGVAARKHGGQAASRDRRDSDSEEESYGGHNLRQTIPTKTRDDIGSITHRPRSALAGGARTLTSGVLDLARDEDEDEYSDGDDEDEDDNNMDVSNDEDDEEPINTNTDTSDNAFEDASAPSPRKKSRSTAATTTTTAGTAPPPPTPPQPTTQPFDLTRVNDDSALGALAATLYRSTGFTMGRDLKWQSAVGGDTTKQKAFRQDATQQFDLVGFGFMRPSSPYVQILHSVATYAVRGGDSEFHNKDFGYVGDRTSLRTPTPVLLDDKLWKWVGKKVVHDIGPLEAFYTNPANRKVLYAADDSTGGTTVNVPRMLYLPPPFLAYCVETQRTPFMLHQFVTQYATRADAEVTILDCQLIMDWCMVAAHRAATPTTSMIATTLDMAPADDDEFLRWLNKIDVTATRSTHGAAPPGALQLGQPASTPPATTRVAHNPVVPTLPTADPTQVMLTRMAESISKSFATAAAAMKPSRDDAGASYEDGGLQYDEFQLAVIQGFAHVEDITGVPIIWALFQYSKNLETHKENLKRKMAEWATSPQRAEHVPINRSLYIPHTTMREILSLTFNPGGVSADADTADQGISILICRARTNAQKAEIKKYERAAEKSKRNWSMADAAGDVTAYDTGALPDDYNELLRCLGTYCALLHALFGDKCPFYRHCYALWTMMNSDLVYDRRDKFSALGCRQIVWAVIEESRLFFAKRLTMDDFTNAQHPDDIPFPTCSLANVVQSLRDGVQLDRLSFPPSWIPGARIARPITNSTTTDAGPAPVQSVGGMVAGATPSVVSGITTGSARSQRPPVTIRATNVHPTIRATMEPFIARNKGIFLTPMLNHVNRSIDDLPKLAPEVSGTNGVCYNFVLGHCTMDGCRHIDGHVNARDVTDEFATELLTLLRPAITEFTTNGVPPRARRRTRRRRRE